MEATSVESQVSEYVPVLTEPRLDSLCPKALQHLTTFKLNCSWSIQSSGISTIQSYTMFNLLLLRGYMSLFKGLDFKENTRY